VSSPIHSTGNGLETAEPDVSLLELLDRLLDRGVVLTGHITISVADVDLIELGLNLMLASVERLDQLRSGERLKLLGGRANA
jgi:hypothetical protein